MGGAELMGMALSIMGWIVAIISCTLPMWQVTAFIGSNIVMAQTIWEGLWMNCIFQSTRQIQSGSLGTHGHLYPGHHPHHFLGHRGKCTKCVEDKMVKARVSLVWRLIFIIVGVLFLIPVCWSANTIICDFYNPLVTDTKKWELGAALYIGWATAALLLLGGGLLCCSCPPKQEQHPALYTYVFFHFLLKLALKSSMCLKNDLRYEEAGKVTTKVLGMRTGCMATL
uniref:Claudin e n=1 Tax=Erpetoichthys calabaricus TaxID=27687 RepID=A0A8C4X4H2_ERPCA